MKNVVRLLAAVVIMAVIAIAGCKKEESRPIPAGQMSSPIGLDNEIKMLKDVLKDDPKNLNALIKLGNAYMDSKRFKEAVDAYGQALAIDPNNIDARVDMGSSLRYSGMPDRAVEEYRKAIKIKPDHAFAHKNLAIVLTYDLGDKAGGAKEFEDYLKIAPNDPDAAQIRQEIERLKAGK